MSSTDGRIPLFEREGFIICFEAQDEMTSLREHFKRAGHEKKSIDAMMRKVGSGKAVWFQCLVTAWRDGKQLAEESLGCCYYNSFEEFYKTEGDYFDDMVRQVILDAKKNSPWGCASCCQMFPDGMPDTCPNKANGCDELLASGR